LANTGLGLLFLYIKQLRIACCVLRVASWNTKHATQNTFHVSRKTKLQAKISIKCEGVE